MKTLLSQHISQDHYSDLDISIVSYPFGFYYRMELFSTVDGRRHAVGSVERPLHENKILWYEWDTLLDDIKPAADRLCEKVFKLKAFL